MCLTAYSPKELFIFKYQNDKLPAKLSIKNLKIEKVNIDRVTKLEKNYI